MKVLTAEEKLEISTRLMSSTNYDLYIEACEILEREDVATVDEAIDWVIERNFG